MRSELTPQRVLAAYAIGIFPMADENGRIHWLAPDPRAIIDPDAFRTTRSLRSTLRRSVFEVSVNRVFEQVVRSCADRAEGTWISRELCEVVLRLHELGFAHSVETWQAGRLAGGLYGVCVGGAFFGESMFHREADASKVALVHLVERMRARGFALLDVQFLTHHLSRFGAQEIPRAAYERRLAAAIRLPVSFVDLEEIKESRESGIDQ